MLILTGFPIGFEIVSMLRSTVTFDALWHCLCPATDRFFARSAQGSLVHSQASRSSRRTPFSRNQIRHRSFHSISQCRQQPRISDEKETVLAGEDVVRRGLPAESPFPIIKKVWNKSGGIEHLYDELGVAASQGNLARVDMLVADLVKSHGQAPSLRLYEALILVNINMKEGSAAKVAAIWKELKSKSLNPTSRTFHKMLKVGQISDAKACVAVDRRRAHL